MSENIFEILRMEKREGAYSNFLSSLFTAERNNSGDNRFLKRFLGLFDEDLPLSNRSIDVDREVKKNGCRADIVLESEDFLIVIENKVTSKETSNQTKKLYENWSGSDKNEIFVYLTPEYREGPECEKFEHITYTQINNILRDLDYSGRGKRFRIMVDDFKEILKKNHYVRFEGLTEESQEYIKSPEKSENEDKYNTEVEYLFVEVRNLLKDDEKISSNSSWILDNKKKRIQVYKEDWDDDCIRIGCKLHHRHIKEGFVRFGIFANCSGKNRTKKWEEFKSHFDSIKNSKESKWIVEEDSDLFNRLSEGENILIEIKEKLMNYVEDYEEILDEVTK